MKHFCFFSLLCFLSSLHNSANAQTKQQVFLKVIDASGQTIRGTSLERGFERQIIATNFSGFTAGNPQVIFTMPSGAATAALVNLYGSKQKLPSALFTITERGEAAMNVTTTFLLEDVLVISASDVNSNTDVTLKASRIGTTSFQNSPKTGQRTISSKTGFDFANKQAWSAF